MNQQPWYQRVTRTMNQTSPSSFVQANNIYPNQPNLQLINSDQNIFYNKIPMEPLQQWQQMNTPNMQNNYFQMNPQYLILNSNFVPNPQLYVQSNDLIQASNQYQQNYNLSPFPYNQINPNFNSPQYGQQQPYQPNIVNYQNFNYAQQNTPYFEVPINQIMQQSPKKRENRQFPQHGEKRNIVKPKGTPLPIPQMNEPKKQTTPFKKIIIAEQSNKAKTEEDEQIKKINNSLILEIDTNNFETDNSDEDTDFYY